MAETRIDPVMMEGVRLIFRNFEGKESDFNRDGERNFGVILTEKAAEDMLADGWNVKRLRPSEEEKEQGIEEGPPWLSVTVNFDKGKPPKIMLVTEEKRVQMKPENANMLDWAEILNVDLIVRPYFWDVNGRSGIKAYLQSMYITIEEDPLDKKYAKLGYE